MTILGLPNVQEQRFDLRLANYLQFVSFTFLFLFDDDFLIETKFNFRVKHRFRLELAGDCFRDKF